MNHPTISATHYHKQAKGMREIAADEPAQDVRAELLVLADDYDRIASLATKPLNETRQAEKAQRQ